MPSNIKERIEKLLRLAAPKSGTSEFERSSAALEAARLFAENNLTIQEKEQTSVRGNKTSSRVRKPPTAKRRWTPPNVYGTDWERSIALYDSLCADPDCTQIVHQGDEVWSRIRGNSVDYVHLGGACGW